MSRTGVVVAPVTRVAWVDRLKLLVIAGVIAFHAGTAYVIDVDWYYEERTTSEVWPVVLAPTFVVALFGLGPLFFVGGWLSVSALRRRGTRGFVGSRLLRLGLPVLVFVAVIGPVTDYFGSRAEGEHDPLLDYLRFPGGERDVGPLWFVIALLVFSLGYAGWRALRPVGRPRDYTSSRTLLTVGSLIAIGDFVVWLGSDLFDDSLWSLNWSHWPQGLGVFVLGVMAGEWSRLEDLPAGHVRRCGLWSLAGFAGLLALMAVVLATGTEETFAHGWRPTAVALALLDGLTAVVVTTWAVGWFQRRWNAPMRPVTAKAARGSYAAYLVHPLVLVGLSAAARPLPWAPEAKFLLVVVIGVPVCLAVGWLCTRVPYVSRVI